MKKCLKVTVSGTFEGESYQTYAQKHAQTLGVEGTLQSTEDGDILILACGITENLDKLIDFLYKGPSPSTHIDDLVAEPYLNAKDFRGTFRVIEN